MRRKAPYGFTLIELLVVISIIGLLISILLPALRTARTSAHVAMSLSNIRQLTLAIHNYASDHKSFLPYGTQGSGSSTLRWPLMLRGYTQAGFNAGVSGQPYIATPNVFWSPGRRMAFSFTDSSAWSWTGYSANNEGPMPFKSSIDAGNRRLVNLDHAKNPPLGKWLLLTEAFSVAQYALGTYDGAWGVRFAPSGDSIFTYNSSAVRSYVDGHAASRNPLDIGWEATDARNGRWLGTSWTQMPDEPWYHQGVGW